MNLLQVKNLEKSFGQRKAVKNVSFNVNKGEVFGLLGPNGAGKSTTLSMICGLQKPDAGTITVGEWRMDSDPMKVKAAVGVVPQDPAIYPQLSARGNLEFWGEINGLRGQELATSVERALRMVGLEDRAKDRSAKLSGGMKRRLNIAAGLLHGPKLLIMDEPTVGVDPQSRNHILETVKALRDSGTAVIYTSHYVEEVEQLCDRVAIMDHGQLLAMGTVAELLSKAGEYQELVIRTRTSTEGLLPMIRTLPGIHDALVQGESLKVLTVSAERVMPLLFEAMVETNIQVSEIKINKPNLESLFLKLTGRALRD